MASKIQVGPILTFSPHKYTSYTTVRQSRTHKKYISDLYVPLNYSTLPLHLIYAHWFPEAIAERRWRYLPTRPGRCGATVTSKCRGQLQRFSEFSSRV